MSHRFATLLLISGAMFQASIAVAQERRADGRFDVAPEIGESVPDLTLVDDQGKPAKVRDLTRGHYTVMTLGCLT